MTEKEDLNKLITNIFGDTDDEEELENVDNLAFESDEDIELPTFKKKQVDDDYRESVPKVPKKKKERSRKKEVQQVEEQVPLSPEAEKKRQAQKDIDAILQRMKPARSKRDLQSEVEVDEMIQQLSQQMRDAAYQDQEFNKNGQPAIAKLKLLQGVIVHLSKVQWHPQLLEQNILECVKFWLEPLSDGSLPSLDIQHQLLDIMKVMPVETHHLRSSLVGRVLMFYTKCPRVQPDVKRKCEVLIRKWMRPILGKSADHRHLQVKQVRYDPRSVKRAVKANTTGEEHVRRTMIPTRVAPDYSVAPASQVSLQPGEKRNEKYKKLKTIMKTMGRKG